MTSSIIIDNDSLRMTAEVLKTINPGRASVDSIRNTIQRSIQEGANTYVSTAGWVAYTWIDENTLKTHVRVSIEPYGVLKYLTGRPA